MTLKLYFMKYSERKFSQCNPSLKADKIRLKFTKKLRLMLQKRLLRNLVWNVLPSCNETWLWGKWTSSIRTKNVLRFLIENIHWTQAHLLSKSGSCCTMGLSFCSQTCFFKYIEYIDSIIFYCDGFVLEIFTDHQSQFPQKGANPYMQCSNPIRYKAS